jgi:hypothetical protein
VQLQLVAGIEEVIRRPFAAVHLPHRHPGRFQPRAEPGEVGFGDAKGVVGIVALFRRSDAPLRIQRQAQPQIAAGEIGPPSQRACSVIPSSW